MKTKVIIKVSILLLIVLLIIVIFSVTNMMLKKKDNKNPNNYTIQDNNVNTLDNAETFESEGIAVPEEGYNNSDYIFYNELEVVEYNNSHLDNIEFSVNNIPNEVVNYVMNIESIKKQIKEYVYLNGLVDSTIADYKKYQIQEEENRIAILFELNNKKKTQIIVIVNKNDNLVKINER